MCRTYYIPVKPDIGSMAVQLQVYEFYGIICKALSEVFVKLFLSAYPFRIHFVCFSHVFIVGLAKHSDIKFLVIKLSLIRPVPLCFSLTMVAGSLRGNCLCYIYTVGYKTVRKLTAVCQSYLIRCDLCSGSNCRF